LKIERCPTREGVGSFFALNFYLPLAHFPGEPALPTKFRLPDWKLRIYSCGAALSVSHRGKGLGVRFFALYFTLLRTAIYTD
jgi:hypothetical protein